MAFLLNTISLEDWTPDAPAERWCRVDVVDRYSTDGRARVSVRIMARSWPRCERPQSGQPALRMKIIGYDPDKYEPPKAVRVVMWYDRQQRLWIIHDVDADGNQVGDAEFSGTKAGAKLIESDRKRAIAGANPEGA